MKLNSKKILKSIMIIFNLIILFLVLAFFTLAFLLSLDDVDRCLDDGGCWDDIRERCIIREKQGYCVKNQEDCLNIWKGEWDFEKQFCIIPNDK